MTIQTIKDRQRNFNAQTWVDVRMFADVCRFYQEQGLEIRTATILRDCLERVHSATMAKAGTDSMFISVEEAVAYLRSVGISTAQMQGDKRTRKKIGDALVLEERFLDDGGKMEKVMESMKAAAINKAAGISPEQIKKMAEIADRLMMEGADNVGNV